MRLLNKDVVIDGTYVAKVSGKLTTVQIVKRIDTSGRASVGIRARTRWEAINLKTGRTVTIKSAAKLRRRIG